MNSSNNESSSTLYKLIGWWAGLAFKNVSLWNKLGPDVQGKDYFFTHSTYIFW